MNCLDCALWPTCSKRSENIVCENFKSLASLKKTSRLSSSKASVRNEEQEDEITSIQSICKAILSEKPVQAKVDDRDVPLAPNFAAWCYRPEFMNLKDTTPPFPWQLKMGLDLYQEVCPYCSDMDWWNNMPVDARVSDIRNKIVITRHGVCPRCKRTFADMMKDKAIEPYIILAACCGQRAGKSLIGSVMAAYQTHKFLKIDIAKEFGLMPSSQFQATFTALVYDQVHRNFYSPYLALIQDSPWFNAYREMLDYYQQKYGEELYQVGERFVRFKHRRMTIMPKSPNVLFMRGFTSFMTAIDELGLFADSAANSKRFDADGLFQTLSTSLLTVEGAWKQRMLKEGKYNLPKPISINISSPYSVSDKIMRLVHDSKSSHRIIGFKRATWEVNPTLPEDSDFVKDRFNQNYAMAMRDLACIPPASANPFIEDDDFTLTKKVCCLDKNNLSLESFAGTTATGKSATLAKITGIHSKGYPSILAVDAGSVDNSFAISIAQFNKGTIEFPVLQEIIPMRSKPINYSSVYDNILKKIIKDFNVKLFTTDRWQSLKFLHDVEEEFRIPTQQFSVKYADFQNFKEDLLAGRIAVPRLEMKAEDVLTTADVSYPECYRGKPISHFVMEMLTVQDLGKTVIKGMNRTDDIFRATILAHHFASMPEWQKKLSARMDNLEASTTTFASRGSAYSGAMPQEQKGFGIVARGTSTYGKHW